MEIIQILTPAQVSTFSPQQIKSIMESLNKDSIKELQKENKYLEIQKKIDNEKNNRDAISKICLEAGILGIRIYEILKPGFEDREYIVESLLMKWLEEWMPEHAAIIFEKRDNLFVEEICFENLMLPTRIILNICEYYVKKNEYNMKKKEAITLKEKIDNMIA